MVMEICNTERTLIQIKPDDESEQPPKLKSFRLRAGDICPICQVELLDYDGLLNLSCTKCGPAAVGCFT